MNGTSGRAANTWLPKDFEMADPFVPPNGFLGFGQQTTATQALLRRKKRPTKKRTRKKVTRRRPATRRKVAAKKRAPAKRARLVKGSAAAKRYMAKLRRMRK